MKSINMNVMQKKYKLLLILFAIVGVVIVLIPAHYGTRVEDDGFNYIATARSLIKGAGFIGYGGAPYVKWGSLYPAILALVGLIARTDPLIPAYYLNAFIFGLIVYLGGLITFRHLSSFPALAIVGTLAILFSIPLF